MRMAEGTVYVVSVPRLNLYDTAECVELATDLEQGRLLEIWSVDGTTEYAISDNSVLVRVREDGYIAWCARECFTSGSLTRKEQGLYLGMLTPLDWRIVRENAISACRAIQFDAGEYLWGGSVGPRYDCSGMIQRAYMQAGVWIPRDAWQQEIHSREILDCTKISKGDLIFFGRSPENPNEGRPNHVGIVCEVSIIYVRSRPIWHVQYMHSSGKENGRNGIGLDSIYVLDDEDIRKVSFFGLYIESKNASEYRRISPDSYYNPRFRRFGRICSQVERNACWPGFKPLPR